MHDPGTSTPPAHVDPDATDRLRGAFDRAGYAEEELAAARGQSEEDADGRPNTAYYERRLAAPTPLHTLVRLFVLGSGVPVDLARDAFAPATLDEVVASGLVSVTGDTVRSPFAVSVVDGLLLVHDPSGASFDDLHPEHVAGVGAAALHLAATTPRRQVGRVLDAGTGSGVHALLAARHARDVVAVDANPRAVAFTDYNATLNGLDVQTRCGDWFEPVAGDSFELVLCNPPFVISPDRRYRFRDGGMPGDRLSADLVRSCADHLTEDGLAVLFCNWAHRSAGDWWEPAARWVEDTGCDAWLLHDETFDPLRYAATWNRGLREPAYGRALDRWTAYFEDAGIAAVTTGVVLLRRRQASRHWLRTAGPELGATLGDHVERILTAEDLLAAGDDALAARRLRLPDDHRLEFDVHPGGGRVEVAGARLRLDRGLRSEVTLDENALFVVVRCDGTMTVEEIAAELAAAKATDASDIRAGVLAAARRLVALGLAVPRDPAAPPNQETVASDGFCTPRAPPTPRNRRI